MRSESSNMSFLRMIKADRLSKTECLAVVIPQSACSATDLDCICNNQALTDSTTACLVANCTVKEALCMGSARNVIVSYHLLTEFLATAKYQKDTRNAPVRDQTDLIAKVNYPLQFIAMFTVAFRVFARSQWGQSAGFWWDD